MGMLAVEICFNKIFFQFLMDGTAGLERLCCLKAVIGHYMGYSVLLQLCLYYVLFPNYKSLISDIRLVTANELSILLMS